MLKTEKPFPIKKNEKTLKNQENQTNNFFSFICEK